MAKRDEASLCWELTQPNALRIVNMACTRSTEVWNHKWGKKKNEILQCLGRNPHVFFFFFCSSHRWRSLLMFQPVWGGRVWMFGTPLSCLSRCVLQRTRCDLCGCPPGTRTPVWLRPPWQGAPPTLTLLAETLESERRDRGRKYVKY